jgi:hypothetical protein
VTTRPTTDRSPAAAPTPPAPRCSRGRRLSLDPTTGP